jgi:hypothetical protein
MAEQLPRGLLADPAMQRAMLLPVARRTYTDPGDDITEEQALELAMPGLLYDPMMGMAQTGAMLMGDMPVDPNVMTQTMLDAPLVGGLLGAATGAAPKGTLLGANVFHGGPHRFAPEPDFPHGRPRLDKVGTGEGNQAYGYGFYSAEAPGVAQTYKTPEGSYQRLTGQMDPKTEFAFDLMEEGQSTSKIMEMMLGKYGDNITFDEAVKAIDGARDIGAGQGTLYKLDIPDADVARYLDYDKPLSEQPKEIRDKFARAMLGERVFDDPILKDLFADGVPNEYMGLFERSSGAQAYRTLAGKLGSEQAASEALRKAGIPGLKYFDADSRGGSKANRTRNYVTWDQDVLDRSKMLERDGVTLGAIKAPTAALPGLLDDTASRMQRARDMGFDVDNPVYHGTSAEFSKFKDTGINWFTTSKEDAEDYVPDRIFEGFLKTTKLADFDAPEVKNLLLEKGHDVNDLFQITEDGEAVKKILKNEGYDGIVVEREDLGATHYAVFDPKDIRSRFAKFDPAKADSADLLAANPATAALPGLLQDRRRKPGRTPRNQNSFPMRGLLGQRLYIATTPDGAI